VCNVRSWCIIAFPTGRDSATFRDKGTEHHCPGTKGQWDKLKILPRDKTGQSSKGRSKTGKGCSKTEKDVLKQERMFKNRDFCSYSCPGTKGHRDKIFFCPRTKGQRDVPSLGNTNVQQMILRQIYHQM
jgi:hypothetical protein